MDGFSIRSSDAMLRTGRTTSELRNSEINKEAGATGDVQSFADTLKSAVNSVNELSHEANKQIQKLATGETKNIPEVMIAAEKSSVAFKLMLQVRNKIIDAYQEVMKMQV
jgi:flagellar hook-basal body complex protein FliE